VLLCAYVPLRNYSLTLWKTQALASLCQVTLRLLLCDVEMKLREGFQEEQMANSCDDLCQVSSLPSSLWWTVLTSLITAAGLTGGQ